MDFDKLTSKDFWLSIPAENSFNDLKISFIIFGVLAIIGLLTLFNRYLYRKMRQKFATFFLTTGLLGAFLLLLRLERINFFSSRFVFLIFSLVMIIWVGTLFCYLIVQMPKEIENTRRYQKFSAYLPKKKRKE
jgi:hypothetical protein